jgi:ATP-dependent DNA helicase DinG
VELSEKSSKTYARVVNSLPSGRVRKGQQVLLEACAQAIERGMVLVAEAATGIGKSLAYLIPAAESENRVVIATATKALQHQLVDKDIPSVLASTESLCLQDVALIKGRHNYICLAKLEGLGPLAGSQIQKLKQACKSPRFGGDLDSLAQLGLSPQEIAGLDLVMDGVECVGAKNCEWGEECFFERAYRSARRSRLVITNQHFVLMHPELLESEKEEASRQKDREEIAHAHGGSEAGKSVLVVDEAHRFEDSLRSALSLDITAAFLVSVARKAEKVFGPMRSAELMRAAVASVFRGCVAAAKDGDNPAAFLIGRDALSRAKRLGLEADPDLLTEVATGVAELAEAAKALYKEASERMDKSGRVRTQRRGTTSVGGEVDIPKEVKLGRLKVIEAVADSLTNLTLEGDDFVDGNRLSWLEVSGSEGLRWRLKSVMLDVAHASRKIIDSVHAAILVSGTLCDSTGFERTAQALGLECAPHSTISATWGDAGSSELASSTNIAQSHPESGILVSEHPRFAYGLIPSPFDLSSKALLYCPSRMPEPGTEGYLDALIEQICELLRISRGAALLLFTSLAVMRSTYDRLRDLLPDLELLVQGSQSPPSLAERFSQNPSSVLFASRTFWEGIDFPGETLRLVVMDRLPFPVPADPVIAARSAALEDQGKSSFLHLFLPMATATFRQGIGRLVRKESDYGVVAVLDSRIHSRQYGRIFERAARPIPLTDSLDDVKQFFDRFFRG